MLVELMPSGALQVSSATQRGDADANCIQGVLAQGLQVQTLKPEMVAILGFEPGFLP